MFNRKPFYVLHPGINNKEDATNRLKLDKGSSYYRKLVWDDKNPKYLFVSEHIYTDKQYLKIFSNYYRSSIKKEHKDRPIYIFFGGESYYPDLNIFDYAIVFSRKLNDSDRIGHMPPMLFHSVSMKTMKNSITYDVAEEKLEKIKFCNFVYSNPDAHYMREILFKELSKYKKVESLGSVFNNTGVVPTRSAQNWRELSIDMKSNYKFTIACENASFEGYTSEKILHAFQAHSVPIYWGNKYVAEEFNPKAFINVHNFDSIRQLIEYVKMIDKNDKIWCEMITQPWQTKEQVDLMNIEIKKYEEFLRKIFDSNINAAKRKPEGTYSHKYSEWFFRDAIK